VFSLSCGRGRSRGESDVSPSESEGEGIFMIWEGEAWVVVAFLHPHKERALVSRREGGFSNHICKVEAKKEKGREVHHEEGEDSKRDPCLFRSLKKKEGEARGADNGAEKKQVGGSRIR